MGAEVDKIKHLQVKPIVQSGSLASLVAAQLEDMLKNAVFSVGEKLPAENALCELFGVSRTVIREAISQLKSRGLLSTQRGVGTTVVRTSAEYDNFIAMLNPEALEDVQHVLELRLTLEPSAAAFAAQRRSAEQLEKIESCLVAFESKKTYLQATHAEDFAFHQAIGQATQNPFFHFIYEQIGRFMIPRSKLSQDGQAKNISIDYLDRVAKEHRAIYSAIKQQRSEEARHAMVTHLNRAMQLYGQAKSTEQSSIS